MADTQEKQEKRALEESGGDSNKKANTQNDAPQDVQDTTEKICKELKEENDALVKLMVERVGCEKAAELLEKAKEIDGGEGIKTADGARKKTAGGIFLHLCRDEIGRPVFNAICQQHHKMKKREKQVKDASKNNNASKKDEKPEEEKKDAKEDETKPEEAAKETKAEESN